MSHGALSKEAHETLATGMNRIKGASCSGEGGEDASRFKVLDNGDSANSRVKQICLLYTSPSPRDGLLSRMPSSA